MTYLALVPLALGTGVYSLWGVVELPRADGWGFVAYNGAVATLTMGSFIRGVLEIADTTSSLLPLFAVAAAVLLALTFVSIMVSAKEKARVRPGHFARSGDMAN
ncbi:MAG: hypothetical protein ACOYJL_04500 [Tractidigestivibacter sp.]|jgi:hypothetical protein|uniref:hypothetical protein n=1 Tax=Tractidigestivibacter sp. TaxID=2847320 RepID=UPI003D8F0B50